MALPDGFLDELRSRLSLAQVVGRKVVWDSRKSNQGKGDMWAPCPFHQEKTASFHVDDRKGYYYCFGCHAKGDAISFVRETENVGFMEAIEILAAEAGLQMPARDPRAQEKSDRRSDLVAVMEAALRWFRLQLKSAAGAEARAYLSGKRGLGETAWDRWEIGFAPPGWEGLREALAGQGIGEDKLLACGLVKPSDKGRRPYDTFRNRIMFPIRDARGRCMAFGGRAMDPSDSAKYLNSPETEIFDKGRVLFNHGPAREAVGKGAALIVAEGYMDVIALAEAGFGGAVAPMGTAITEDQLALLWRIADEPVVALDGDTAGLRAGMRLIDLALPMLEAGRTLRFALLPEGKDPDDLLKESGREAMQAVLDAAQPLVRLLWRRETEGRVFDSPERRAAVDKILREKLRLIRDPSVRQHYGEEIRRLRAELWGIGGVGAGTRAPGSRGPWRPRGMPEPPRPSTKANPLTAGALDPHELREAAILAIALRHPAALAAVEAQVEALELTGPDHTRIRDAMLRRLGVEDLEAAVAEDIGRAPLDRLFSYPHLRIVPAVQPEASEDMATLCLTEELAKLAASRGHPAEVAEAIEDLTEGRADERLTQRLARSGAMVQRAALGDDEDRTTYDVGPNGARVSRDEKDAFSRLLRQIGHEGEKDTGTS